MGRRRNRSPLTCQRGPILRLDPPNLPDSETRSADDFETGGPATLAPRPEAAVRQNRVSRSNRSNLGPSAGSTTV